ncbi:phosphomannomutase CpsG [Yersinia pseudotuberculosis]|uniref:Phosphomannomutase n=1 Tax=Yersinia pseudotuberculosis TaxID=633 RepID=F1CLM4_YERPU|nr:phosphomannomutase CpsG [Yersinia pseudotuberculosis]ADX97407.1 phosphomannomutase [Yersinia pseudotuberculosis]CFV22444.1 phosphomannomutase [Yersinia pseudotuberculosis]
MKKLTCFKSYDIRGKLDDEINEDVAYRIGRAYGEFEKPRSVVVGGDVRLSSESLKLALSHGLQDAGVDVLDIGLSGTEEIYFSTFHLDVDGGIEVTASHNPIDYNGMKLVRRGARPISGDTGLRDIQKLAELNEFPPVDIEKRGGYKKISIIDEYIDHIIGYINPSSFKPLKLVVNSGNGAAGPIIDALERRFSFLDIPITLFKINNNPDGNFPNGIPNPLLPECRQDTSDAVLAYRADMGIAFDGDFDRCFFFDDKGKFIEGYYIVGLLAQLFIQKEPGSKIIYDPRLCWNTIDIVSAAGGKSVMSKAGHAFIKERMRLEDAIYGGELSAHHYFRDFAYCDSGMIPWLLIAELISIRNKSLANLVNEQIVAYPSSGEINRKVENPLSVINKIKSIYQKNALLIDETDGISMEFECWRFNLRISNTESVIRLNVESRADVNLMMDKTKEIITMLND